MGYLTNFIVYMLAMVGVLVVAMLIFKHTTGCAGKSGSGKCLKVLDTLSLGARKTLYIVSAGDEKFLIAGDTDRTSLISKLNTKNSCEEAISAIMTTEQEDFSTKSFKEPSTILPKKSYVDRSSLGITSTQSKPYDAVMKNLAERIRG